MSDWHFTITALLLPIWRRVMEISMILLRYCYDLPLDVLLANNFHDIKSGLNLHRFVHRGIKAHVMGILDIGPSTLLPCYANQTLPTAFTRALIFRPFTNMSSIQVWQEEQHLANASRFGATNRYRMSPPPPMPNIVTNYFVKNHAFPIFGLVRQDC
jgi:hypothetical protein